MDEKSMWGHGRGEGSGRKVYDKYLTLSACGQSVCPTFEALICLLAVRVYRVSMSSTLRSLDKDLAKFCPLLDTLKQSVHYHVYCAWNASLLHEGALHRLNLGHVATTLTVANLPSRLPLPPSSWMVLTGTFCQCGKDPLQCQTWNRTLSRSTRKRPPCQ